LKALLKAKEREKEEAMHIEDTYKDWLQSRLKCSRLYFVFGGEEQKKERLYPCMHAESLSTVLSSSPYSSSPPFVST
jgi:hypothetical protein